MAIQTRQIEYKDGDILLEAYMAWDDAGSDRRPGVLISHAWAGRGEFEEDKAAHLAELGYVGFALDLYGKGVKGGNPEQNRELMQPLLDDRVMLQRRMHLALENIRKQKEVDAERVAAMGFCFGGLCVLDLARTGADILGAASFHGLFSAPGNTADNKISAKVLAMHGWDDPMATPDDVMTFSKEMSAADTDWQLHAYGRAMHAFTNPGAQMPNLGMQYSAKADRRSFAACKDFLVELFG